MIISKKLIRVGLSKAVILPKAWLDQFGDIDEVFLDINGKIIITPAIVKKESIEASLL